MQNRTCYGSRGLSQVKRCLPGMWGLEMRQDNLLYWLTSPPQRGRKKLWPVHTWLGVRSHVLVKCRVSVFRNHYLPKTMPFMVITLLLSVQLIFIGFWSGYHQWWRMRWNQQILIECQPCAQYLCPTAFMLWAWVADRSSQLIWVSQCPIFPTGTLSPSKRVLMNNTQKDYRVNLDCLSSAPSNV